MFSQVLSNTPLTSNQANVYFANRITGESWRNDSSFLATMRALLDSRMPEGDKVSLLFYNNCLAPSAIEQYGDKKAVNSICDYMSEDPHNAIFIHNFNSGQAGANAGMELMKRCFTSVFSKYELVQRVEAFYKPAGVDVICFVNKETKTTVLFVSKLDLRKLHFLQTGTLIYFPWYFDPEAGCSEAELRLIKATKKDSPDDYLDALKEIEKQFDFRTGFIRSSLSGFEKRRNERFLVEAESNLQGIDRDIDDLMQRISSRMKDRESIEQRVLGIRLRVDQSDGDSELMEYFVANKSLSLESVSGDTLYFAVNTYMEYFDPEVAERTINNPYSFVHRGGDKDEKIVEVLKAIFLESTLRLRFCAAYRLSPDGVEGRSDHDFDPDIINTSMPNPHIQGYHCLGNYVREINTALRKNDYISAVEQCIASAKSLNWTDSTVMGSFIRSMYENEHRCIELPDGKVVKPLEAYDWLQSQKGEAAHE